MQPMKYRYSTPCDMGLRFRSCAHSDLLVLILPHGLPFLNVLSKASRRDVATWPSSMTWLRMSIRKSYGTMSFGQRSPQVAQVVQLHSSFAGCTATLPPVATSRMYLLMFRLAFRATGQPPVHIPHCIHSRSLCF